MKKVRLLIAFVAILSLLLASTVSAQDGTPGGQGDDTFTYTTSQGDSLGDLLDRAGIDVGHLAEPSNENDIALLRTFVSENSNLRFGQGANIELPAEFDDTTALNQIEQVSLGRMVARLGLFEDNDRMRSFFAANMDLPVRVGQMVQLPIEGRFDQSAEEVAEDAQQAEQAEEDQRIPFPFSDDVDDQEQDVTPVPDTGDVEPDQDMTIPQTGDDFGDDVEQDTGVQMGQQDTFNAPIYGSALTSWGVYGSRGELTGEVRGFILDTTTGQIPYIVVLGDSVLSYHTVLIPWDSFSIIDSPEAQGFFGLFGGDSENVGRAFDPSRDMAVRLQITEQQFEDAPGFDISIFDTPEDLDVDWDADDVDYWNNTLGTTNLQPYQDINGLMLVKSGIFDRIDFDVMNLDGAGFGEIEHLLINTDGTVRYGLLDPDNLDLNITGNDFIPVSLQAMTWSPDQDAFIVDLPEGAFTDAPVFDPDNLPNFDDENWDQEWNTYWNQYEDGEQAGTNVPVTGELVTRSDVIGDTIMFGNNRPFGTVQDVIVGADNQIDYVVSYYGNTDQFHPIPWSMFDYDAENDQLNFNGDITQLSNSPGFDRIGDIDTDQEGWNDQVDSYWEDQ